MIVIQSIADSVCRNRLSLAAAMSIATGMGHSLILQWLDLKRLVRWSSDHFYLSFSYTLYRSLNQIYIKLNLPPFSTGTTFLLEVLGNHPEITMPEKHSEDSFKICVKKQEGKEILKQWIQKQQQEHLLQQSEMSTATASSKKRTKYGVKCSQMIRKPLGIDNFADVSTAKLIVGLRHPVEWFQSNYNYRCVATFMALIG